jgi:SAM-dependent methyltransferase
MFNEVSKKFKSINLDEMRFPGFMKKRTLDIERCVENVNRGHGWREISNCPLCEHNERQVIFNRCDINIVQCNQCGCGYVEKIPIDTSDVYGDEDYLLANTGDYLKNVEYRKERFGVERLRLIAQCLDRSPSESRLLDVGCGTGWFLEVAREAGYEAFGQEWGKALATNTSERLNIKIWNESLTEIDKREKFDVITLFDVLEHIPNPKGMLLSIKEHLTDKGIAMLFVPNLDSLGFWRLKEQACMVTPAEHLIYYTGPSLRRVFSEIGFEVLMYETRGMDIPDIYAYYREKENQNQVAEFLKEHCNVLQAIVDRAGCANHMRFIIKKK